MLSAVRRIAGLTSLGSRRRFAAHRTAGGAARRPRPYEVAAQDLDREARALRRRMTGASRRVTRSASSQMTLTTFGDVKSMTRRTTGVTTLTLPTLASFEVHTLALNTDNHIGLSGFLSPA